MNTVLPITLAEGAVQSQKRKQLPLPGKSGEGFLVLNWFVFNISQVVST